MLSTASVTLLLQSCGFVPIRFSGVALMPGHIALSLLPFTITLLYCSRSLVSTISFASAAGIAAADCVALVLRANSEYLPGGFSHAAPLALPAVLIVLFGMSVAVLLMKTARPPQNPRRDLPLIALSALALTIVIFRIFHHVQVSLGVPNTERSLLLGGQEIHHIVPGSIGCFAIGLLLLANPDLAWWRTIAAALGILLGTVADQVLYYCLAEVTDAAYDGVPSTVGAVVFGVLYATFLLVGYRRAVSDCGATIRVGGDA